MADGDDGDDVWSNVVNNNVENAENMNTNDEKVDSKDDNEPPGPAKSGVNSDLRSEEVIELVELGTSGKAFVYDKLEKPSNGNVYLCRNSSSGSLPYSS